MMSTTGHIMATQLPRPQVQLKLQIPGLNSYYSARYQHCARLHLRGAKLEPDPRNIGILYQLLHCINSTGMNTFELLRDSVTRNKDRELPILMAIIFVYALFMVLGCTGNGLVICTVYRNQRMRTERNFYIFNLAVSDFVLCCVTQPLNILRLLQTYISWEYGLLLCRMTNMLTGLNMFVSTFSITAVAVDRFRAIVHATPGTSTLTGRRRHLILSLLAIWGSAAIAASPLAFFATVTENLLHKPPVKICFELPVGWLMNRVKLAYSAATILVQYLLPLAIVLVAYAKIYARMRDRLRQMKRRRQSVVRRNAEALRQRRANLLLIAISVTFALSWLPLSVVNIVQEYRLLGQPADSSAAASASGKKLRPQSGVTTIASLLTGNRSARNSNAFGSTSTFVVVAAQSIPLLLTLVSACLNPVFYGWFNDNFQTEFKRLANGVFRRRQSSGTSATREG